jgi:hypothetical protein
MMPDAPPPSVTLRNLTATLTGDNARCATNGSGAEVACPEYAFRFVLRNDGMKDIAIVDHLRLGFGTEELFNETAGICTAMPWSVAAGTESALITVRFSYTQQLSDIEFRPRFYYDCGTARTRSYAPGRYKFGEVMPSLPISGTVTLKVEGIHTDGAPFMASGPTVLTI